MRNQVQPVKIMMTSNEAVSNSVQFSSVGLTQTAANTQSSRQQKMIKQERELSLPV